MAKFPLLTKYGGEMVFLLFKTAESILEPVIRIYIFQFSCFEIYSHEAPQCSLGMLEDSMDRETEVLAAFYTVLYKNILYIPNIFLGLITGAWSDKVGRKVPVIVACLGAGFAILCYITSMLETAPTLILFLIGTAFRGTFGKSAMVTMAVHSQIVDNTDIEDRTRRLGILLAMNFLGLFLGSLFAGLLMEVGDFSIAFAVVSVLIFVYSIYAIFFMADGGQAQEDGSSGMGNLCSLTNIKESVGFMFRKREGLDRMYLIITFTTIVFHQTFKSGEMDIILFYVTGPPLYWSSSMYGYFLAVNYLACALCAMFVIPVLSSTFGVSDYKLLLFGTFIKIANMLSISFVRTTWILYFTFTVGALCVCLVTASKSIISKIVYSDEIGKAFALISCAETISNLIGSAFMTVVYQATQDIYKGLVYIIESGIFIAWFLLVFFVMKNSDKPSALSLLNNKKEHAKYDSVEIGKSNKIEPEKPPLDDTIEKSCKSNKMEPEELGLDCIMDKSSMAQCDQSPGLE